MDSGEGEAERTPLLTNALTPDMPDLSQGVDTGYDQSMGGDVTGAVEQMTILSQPQDPNIPSLIQDGYNASILLMEGGGVGSPPH